ncbi:hypothetical protein [Fusobacterium massiliense]|uniref:hypothetical protein n=1 Tax=Fusobacterium massiliense TaxID=1852365 RepID=UPI0028E295BD|nr:hypothetical protein [Fusobacterium massiliense]
MAKKIIVIVFSILIFNACSMIDKQYTFSAIEDIKGISIVGTPKDIYSENSSLSSIWISDAKNWDGKERKLKLLDNEIKIIKDGREYIIPYSDIENKKNDINIYIKVVNIINEDFLLYIGRVQLDNGEIVNIPPLHFKKYIYIKKSGILAGFDPVGKFKSYSGTLEEYKKNGWKEE